MNARTALVQPPAVARGPGADAGRRSRIARIAWTALRLVSILATAGPAHAQVLSQARSLPLSQAASTAEPAPALDGLLEARVRQILGDAARTATLSAGAGPAPRIEIHLGQLDRRLRLAPCLRIEPYLPEAGRAWGRGRVGLRCLEGTSRWNVYLPVDVKVFGSGLVATTALPAGAVLTAGDLVTGDVDLAEEATPALGAPDAAVGRALARPLAAGQSVRASHLKARQWFAAGATVTIVAQGDGFSVAGEAQALNAGIEGQPVRLRTEGGRIVSGMPVGEHRVEIAL